MSLTNSQWEFTHKLPLLFAKAWELGFEFTLGDAYRDPRVFGEIGVRKGYGTRDSFHKIRCAIDLNLFKDGEYLITTEAHNELGAYWESIGGTWGGNFKRRDGNHYSWKEHSR